jgi:hypothetical protein
MEVTATRIHASLGAEQHTRGYLPVEEQSAAGVRRSSERGGCGNHYNRGSLSTVMSRKEVARSGEVAATSPRVYPEKEVAVHQNGQTAMRKEVRSEKRYEVKRGTK